MHTMNIIDPVTAVLDQKGRSVFSIPPETIVFDAIHLMDERNVGALLVMQGTQLVGIVSERDYTRKVVLKGRSSRDTKVSEIMTPQPRTVTTGNTVEDCMRIMTAERVRHLPVMDGDQVVGVVSIGNLVNWIISAQSAQISQLQSYVAGQYPG